MNPLNRFQGRWRAAVSDVGIPLLAVGSTIIVTVLMFWALGYRQGGIAVELYISPFLNFYGISEIVLKAAPLVLVALGLSWGFRSGIWNIGAEGQLIFGAIGAGSMALWVGESAPPGSIVLLAVVAAGSGAAWAAIPAWLHTRFHASEILTSLMLTYIASKILNALLRGYLQDPSGQGFLESKMFGEWALLPVVQQGTRIHSGIFVVAGAILCSWWIARSHIASLHMDMHARSPTAARFAGARPPTLVWIAFLLSGACAGLAGMLEVTGLTGQLVPSVSSGIGFLAIVVSFLGRHHPLGIVAAAVWLSGISIGAESLQIKYSLPEATALEIQGLSLLFLLSFENLRFWRIFRFPPTGSVHCTAEQPVKLHAEPK